MRMSQVEKVEFKIDRDYFLTIKQSISDSDLTIDTVQTQLKTAYKQLKNAEKDATTIMGDIAALEFTLACLEYQRYFTCPVFMVVKPELYRLDMVEDFFLWRANLNGITLSENLHHYHLSDNYHLYVKRVRISELLG
jgi:hypothetical protein